MDAGSIAANYVNQYFTVFKQSTAQINERMQQEVAERRELAVQSMENTIEMMQKRVDVGRIDLYA